MDCLTVITKCRLCGAPFEERICQEGYGWLPQEQHGHLLENGMPWCQRCLEEINHTCELLLADTELDTKETEVETSDEASP